MDLEIAGKRLRQVTRSVPYDDAAHVLGGVEWLIEVPFETFEQLEHYLMLHNPGGEIAINGWDVWASDRALRAAVSAFEAEERERSLDE
jgi:hypothetical protein